MCSTVKLLFNYDNVRNNFSRYKYMFMTPRLKLSSLRSVSVPSPLTSVVNSFGKQTWVLVACNHDMRWTYGGRCEVERYLDYRVCVQRFSMRVKERQNVVYNIEWRELSLWELNHATAIKYSLQGANKNPGCMNNV